MTYYRLREDENSYLKYRMMGGETYEEFHSKKPENDPDISIPSWGHYLPHQENLPTMPDELWKIKLAGKYETDFSNDFNGIIVSDKLREIISRLTHKEYVSCPVNIANRKGEILQKHTYIKFLEETDVLDLKAMDIDGEHHALVGGQNTLFKNEHGFDIVKRANRLIFKKTDQDFFVAQKIPRHPFFCSERFRTLCDEQNVWGVEFDPVDELVVSDVRFDYDSFLEIPPGVSTRKRLEKWPPIPDRSEFFDPLNVDINALNKLIFGDDCDDESK